MDWITGLQKSIDYIENHLLEKIDYEVVAWLPVSGYQLADSPKIVVSHWCRHEKRDERYRELWIPIIKCE